MKFLRAGFWQKLVLGLLLVAQLALIIFLFFVIFDLAFGGQNPTALIISLTVLYVADLIVAAYIMNVDRPDAYRLGWFFIVVALPLAGVILYVLIANKQTNHRQLKKLARWAKPIEDNPTDPFTKERLRIANPDAFGISEYLCYASGGGIHEKTSAEYFPLVDYAFEPILREIRRAKHYIFLEFFIVTPGVFWNSILEELKKKASEGVDVRFIYDDVGSLGTVPYRYYDELRKMGIKAYAFNKFRPLLDIKLNNRDHRKMLIIDGHTCFTGGFNLADEYVNKEDRFGHWKDNALLLRGEAVSNFTYMFLANYVTNCDRNENIDKSYYDAGHFIDEIGGFPKSNGFIQPYGDVPFDSEAVGERVYLSIVQRAKKYVYITTPYLIIDKETENTLIYAAREGVDVRLLLPHIPDKMAVFQIARSFYGKLIAAGVKVYEYTPGFVHEKVFISDDRIATCGTINLDYRSLFLHLECGTLMTEAPVIDDMKRDYLDTLALSHQVTYAEWKRWHSKNKAYWAMLRIFAPFL